MRRKRVSENQLSFGKHLDAPEQLHRGDKLEEQIRRKKEQLRLCRAQLQAEWQIPLRTASVWRINLREETIRELQEEEKRFLLEIVRLESKRAKIGLGRHPNFRTPTIEGYGLADAIRAEEKRTR